MVSLNTSKAALAAFNAGDLFGFTVKLLNLPAQGTHVLSTLRGILSEIVGRNEVRAPGGEHQSEQFHLMTFRKVLDMDQLAMLLLINRPLQLVNALVGLLTLRVIDQPIGFERTVVDFAQILNVHHQLALGIPAIHQHSTKGKLLVGVGIVQHLAHMIQLSLTVPVRVENPVVDDPGLVSVWIDVDTRHHPDAFDDPMHVPTVLSPHQLNLERAILVQYSVVERQIPIGTGHKLTLDILPHYPRRDFLAFQIAFDRIMAKILTVLRKVCQGVIGLRYQQKLTIVQSGYRAHAF